jgi:hypothetical protein
MKKYKLSPAGLVLVISFVMFVTLFLFVLFRPTEVTIIYEEIERSLQIFNVKQPTIPQT